MTLSVEVAVGRYFRQGNVNVAHDAGFFVIGLCGRFVGRVLSLLERRVLLEQAAHCRFGHCGFARARLDRSFARRRTANNTGAAVLLLGRGKTRHPDGQIEKTLPGGHLELERISNANDLK